MIFDIKALAHRKHNETKHELGQWVKALESAQMSLNMTDIDFLSLEYIVMASSSPANFTVVARLIYQYGKSHPNGDQILKIILNYTNVSRFDLSDWIEAISYFYEWLDNKAQKIDLLPMLKYLECCAEAPDAKEQGQTLTSLLENMLDVHGYEAGCKPD